ncbi:MAG: serine/threonine protein kinase [bacterium]|nr:serine/threonine protein kinase [bacterium]
MAQFPVIPGYRIKKKIGQGGMADVYLGVQQNLSRMVAVKVLNLEVFRNPRLAKRFVKEAKTLSRLVHPNIVTIYDVGQVGHFHYIVMEYLQDSLKDKIKKKREIPPEEAFHIVTQVAEALFYAHDKGVIHRDIKPDNILFRQDGTPVVLDFGIAKNLDSKTKLTKTGMSVGTPQYMSPEQCSAENPDGRSDIYSLGVVLYEMLAGKAPYDAKDTIGIVMKHLKAPIPSLPIALKLYQPIIDRMMAKDKKKRLRSKDQLNEVIKNLLNLAPKKTKSTKPGTRSTAAKKNEKVVDSKTRASVTVNDKEKKPLKQSGNAETKKEKGSKAKLILIFLLAATAVILVLQVLQDELLPEFITALGKFFKAIGNFLF